MAQLASARFSERAVPGSILGDLNVCFDFPLILVAIALNTHKTEQPRSQGLSYLPPLSLLNDNGGREERPWERG